VKPQPHMAISDVGSRYYLDRDGIQKMIWLSNRRAVGAMPQSYGVGMRKLVWFYDWRAVGAMRPPNMAISDVGSRYHLDRDGIQKMIWFSNRRAVGAMPATLRGDGIQKTIWFYDRRSVGEMRPPNMAILDVGSRYHLDRDGIQKMIWFSNRRAVGAMPATLRGGGIQKTIWFYDRRAVGAIRPPHMAISDVGSRYHLDRDGIQKTIWFSNRRSVGAMGIQKLIWLSNRRAVGAVPQPYGGMEFKKRFGFPTGDRLGRCPNPTGRGYKN
jgi:hypothetical protein